MMQRILCLFLIFVVFPFWHDRDFYLKKVQANYSTEDDKALTAEKEKQKFIAEMKALLVAATKSGFTEKEIREITVTRKGKEIKFKSKENEMLYHFCIKKLKNSFYNFFIFGHRHLPLKIDLGNNSFYFNTGDWINHYSFLVFDGSEVLLKYFNKIGRASCRERV